MSILRNAGREVAGAWRSLRYDLRPRPAQPDAPGDGYPDVTSTGLSTFGDGMPGDGYGRRPNRLVAVAAFGLLALAGAAGSYLAVAKGLGGFAVQRDTAAPRPVPLVAEPGPLPPGPPPGSPPPGSLPPGSLPPGPAAAPPAPALRGPQPAAAAATTARRAVSPREAATPGTGPVPPRTLPRTMAPPVRTPCACPPAPTRASVSPSKATPAPRPSASSGPASGGPGAPQTPAGSAAATRGPARY